MILRLKPGCEERFLLNRTVVNNIEGRSNIRMWKPSNRGRILSSVILNMQHKSTWVFAFQFLTPDRVQRDSRRHHARNVSEVHAKSFLMFAGSGRKVKIAASLLARQVHKCGLVLYFFFSKLFCLYSLSTGTYLTL